VLIWCGIEMSFVEILTFGIHVSADADWYSRLVIIFQPILHGSLCYTVLQLTPTVFYDSSQLNFSSHSRHRLWESAFSKVEEELWSVNIRWQHICSSVKPMDLRWQHPSVNPANFVHAYALCIWFSYFVLQYILSSTCTFTSITFWRYFYFLLKCIRIFYKFPFTYTQVFLKEA